MYRSETSQNTMNADQQVMMASAASLNANDVDTWLTPNPTPKVTSRRAWRRRRMRSGKS